MKRLIKPIVILSLLAMFVLPRHALAQEPPACEFEYTVQAGDWLSKIAEKYYGDPLAYTELVVAANADAGDAYTNIDDPDLIEPGWKICVPSDEDPATGPQPAPAGLSQEALANATYQSEFTQDGTAPLSGGEYSEEAAPGSATMTTVRLTDNIAYGNLNGQEAAAVILVTDPGGSGTFFDLAVIVNQDGQAVNTAITNLGDRIKLNSLSIENNEIVVDMVQTGPDDPLCCPSQRVIKTYQLEGDQLMEISSEVMASASSSPDLVGTLWRWDQTLMNNDDTFVPADPANYTVQFLPEGQVSIQADCNQVNGTYTLEDNALTITLGPTTLAACPPGSLGDQFTANLGQAALYFIQDQTLFIDLKFDSGTMQFTAQSTDLGGTSWIVTGYNNGNQAVVSPIIDTHLTAGFSQDGGLTGSAGCNNYNTTYQVDGDAMTIGPIITTRKACPEPEGVMDQEQQYLAALESATVYQLRGNRLEMRTADGALAVSFQAAN